MESATQDASLSQEEAQIRMPKHANHLLLLRADCCSDVQVSSMLLIRCMQSISNI